MSTLTKRLPGLQPRFLLSLGAAVLLSACASNGQKPDPGPDPSSFFASVGKAPISSSQSDPRFATSNTPSPAVTRRVPQRVGGSAAPIDLPDPAQFPQGNDITLNFVDAELDGVVAALARFTGQNFIVDPRVKGQLTLVSEVPVDARTAYEMLLSALRMQGFAVLRNGKVSRVVPEAEARQQGGAVRAAGAGASGSGELETRVFTLRYENATALVPVLRPMISPNNPINAYPSNNTLVVTDYGDNLDRIAQVIAGIDTPAGLNTDIIPIDYGVALDVAALASQMLDTPGNDVAQRITVVADPRSNSVLVRAGSPARLDLARDLIRRIDSPESNKGNLHVVYLRNAQAVQLAEVLRAALTGQSGSGTSSTGTQQKSNSLAPTPSTGMAGGAKAMNTAATPAQPQGEAGLSAVNNASGTVAFSAGGATVQADPSTNTLIISAPDPVYRSLREVIDQLDQRRAQVLVESLIVEVNAENAAEFGIQWMTGGGNIADGSGFVGGANLGGSGITKAGATTLDSLAAGLSLGVVKGTVNVLGQQVVNLGVLARALERQGGTNILSTPNLMTLDNEEASIMVGRTVPFVTGQYTTTGDGASNPFQTIQREDVGLTLKVRPQISEGGTVKMALYQEVSSIDTAMSVSANSPVTRKRALSTNVLVDDGQIIVLGGLLEDSIEDGTQSVPLLGDIPLVGNLFKYEKRKRTKTNLMVFLRPHIVRNAQDSQSLSLDRYNYMRAVQTGLPDRSTWFHPDAGHMVLPPSSGAVDLRESL
ncbi:type II secretion system secretin GspD [Alcaligenes parafaecalis]|uniref:Type II secretion system secretin GspD n=1 Tax=Alcaligenes parafaecalis TaxID=171260 RepID=A0ABT3VRQ0_9BURK|nr:type II secretion system secretin GspD [Alcaligenes parafaecalis]MCX5465988.1 type II secretion system secretin GspD [Alcaligenes parafaecalis]